MAKCKVTYSCGHEGVLQLHGRMAERERRIKWYEERGLCPECYSAKAERERQEATDRAVQAVAGLCLPTLTGTPRQVAWAEVIRARAVGVDVEHFKVVLESAYGQLLARGFQQERVDALLLELPAGREGLDVLMNQYYGEVKRHEDARFWIDRRDSVEVEVATSMMANWLVERG